MRRLGNGLLWLLKLPLYAPWVIFVYVAGYLLIAWRALTTIGFAGVGHLVRHAFRVMKFGAVGGTVAVIGFGILYYLQHVMPQDLTPGQLAKLGVMGTIAVALIFQIVSVLGRLPKGKLTLSKMLKAGLFCLALAVTGSAILYMLQMTTVFDYALGRGTVHVPQRVGIGFFTNPTALVIESLISVELNFLGSYFITWRDRRVNGFVKSLLRFNLARLISFSFNQVYQSILTGQFHQPAPLANLAAIIVGAAFNYQAGDMYVFAPGETKRTLRPEEERTVSMDLGMPEVSIVIPCRNNPDTIRQVVTALLAQDFFKSNLNRRNLKHEIILVGSPGDTTWGALRDILARGAVDREPIEILELEVAPPSGYRGRPGRDSNAKRTAGLKMARGNILVLMDADVVPPPHWLYHIVLLLTTRKELFVAGPVYGITKSFLGLFIDRNTSASKTPRIGHKVRLTIDNIGEFKPPVTANLAFRRQVMKLAGTPWPGMWKSYEDYQFAWEALRSWFSIRLDPQLAAPRYHRERWLPLVSEYRRSGMGAGDFMAIYPESPFSVFRLVQLLAIPFGLAAAAVGAVLFPVQTAVIASAVILSSILSNLLAVKGRPDGILYPFVGAFLTAQFVYGVCYRFVRWQFRRPAEPKIGKMRRIYPMNLPQTRGSRHGKDD